jgi:hypothetical protein
MHQALGEPMPRVIFATGDRFINQDNTQTPDTMMATFHYPRFLATYESRTYNSTPRFGHGAATSIHGTKGTVIVNRSGCWIMPTRGSDLKEVAYEKDDELRQMNVPHWQNFLECIRTRQRPISDIENCARTSIVCILANLSMLHSTRLDWDEAAQTVRQEAVRPFLKARYREPWKLEI